MSFQKSHIELTLAEVLQIVRAWLRDYEMHNAHIRIGQGFGPLVRDQVLFTIDVVQVALPSDATSASDAVADSIIAAPDVPTDEITPYDTLDVVEVSDAETTEEEELRF